MKKITAILIVLAFNPILSRCQTTDKIANDAFVLTRMVSKFHVEPRDVNSLFSENVFTGMLNKTDAGHIFFTQNDISKLGVYRKTIDKEIKQRKAGYLSLFINIYSKRLKQTDSLINELDKKPLNFYADEKLIIADDTLYAISQAARQTKLLKIIKADVVEKLTDDLPEKFKSFTPASQKKYVDSAVFALQKKITASLRRKINNILQNSYGLTQYVGNLYCETIASCFDPHTAFFPPEEKENFESELGKQPFQFGFRIKPEKNGGILIDNLQPGSPAYKSGKLNKGDKFISLQWEGGQAVDVSDISIDDFDDLVDQSNHKKILFSVKKADGTLVQVPLEKELATADDDDKVKSFILKGDNTVGYIYLPAFYEDWETNNDGLNGCANDVGREILKLKKENISGLILDLRYNGGGSVSEATELAGIFIDAGPVAQEKSRDAKVSTIKDTDRGTIYDGPLVILVNGYSASASELVAGTLQDYNRAVIIGSPTYGKATMQVVLPLDTTVTPENFMQKHTDDYLKLTVGKLYRINGTSAQFKGVQPDIVLPDALDAYATKEADEPYALLPSAINANKYYQPYSPLPIKMLAQSVQPEIDTSKYFNAIKSFINLAKQKITKKDISLNVKDALANPHPAALDADSVDFVATKSKKFTVQNNQYELERLKTDENLKAFNEQFSKQVGADAYINIAYTVLTKLKSQ